MFSGNIDWSNGVKIDNSLLVTAGNTLIQGGVQTTGPFLGNLIVDGNPFSNAQTVPAAVIGGQYLGFFFTPSESSIYFGIPGTNLGFGISYPGMGDNISFIDDVNLNTGTYRNQGSPQEAQPAPLGHTL